MNMANGHQPEPQTAANGNGGSVAVKTQTSAGDSPREAFDQPVVLRQPRAWSRAVIWSLMGVTTVVVAWAFIAKVDEAVPAQGKLEPKGAVTEVQAPVGGVVKEVNIKDGSPVQAGDVLLTLDPKVTKAEQASLKKVRDALVQENRFYEGQVTVASGQALPESLTPQELALTQNRAALQAENEVYRRQITGGSASGLSSEEQARLQVSQQEFQSRVSAAQLDVGQSQRQLDQVRAQLSSARDLLRVDQGILNDLTTLFKEGGIAKLQYRQQEQQVRSRQGEVDRLEQEERRLELQIAQAGEQVRNTISLSQSDLFSRIAENDKRIAEIESQLSRIMLDNQRRIAEIDGQLSQTQATLDYQIVKAPTSGTVFDLKAKSPGYVISDAREPILKIVPGDALVANVFITNKDIGFVEEGQAVDVRIDSFPFSEFGDIKGTLEWIGSDALPPDEIYRFYRFPARVKLDRQYIALKSRDGKDGKQINLQSGMSVSVNIKLRKRSVASIFTELFTRKTESLKNVR